MKFGWFFSICVYLFVSFHVSESASCLFESGMKDCSSCVMYGCKSGVTNYGCPEDFFTECATHTNIVSFIKRHNYNDLEYVQNFGVTYISCGTCSSGDLGMKFANARLKITTSSVDYCVEAGKPCTENPLDPSPSTSKPVTTKPPAQFSTFKPLTSRATVKSSSSPITTKPPVLDTDTSKPPPPPDATNEPQPSASTPAPSNVSNNQNSALKFIGILAFGWITADWIF